MARTGEGGSGWSSFDDVRWPLDRRIRASSGVCGWIQRRQARADDTSVPLNFLACSVTYLEIARNALPAPIQVTALCTRAVYELFLLARKVLPDAQERRRWLHETASDNVSVMEAWRALAGRSSPAGKTLRGHIDSSGPQVAATDGNLSHWPSRLGELAREFGLEKEHTALIGLFSKLAHPSAFLANGWPQNKEQALATTLMLTLLDYADRLLRLVGDHVCAPEEMIRW
jgi:hypothetical protein